MKKLLLSVLIALLACSLATSAIAEEVYPKQELREKLLEMMKADQDARGQGDVATANELDRKHARFLHELLESSDWPRVSEVGRDGAQAAWILAQHADHDVDLQKTVLAVLEAYLEQGEANSRDVALLYDRVAVAESRAQKYGTQGRCVGEGRWEPREIESPETVDVLRTEAGLQPLESYMERMHGFCK